MRVHSSAWGVVGLVPESRLGPHEGGVVRVVIRYQVAEGRGLVGRGCLARCHAHVGLLPRAGRADALAGAAA